MNPYQILSVHFRDGRVVRITSFRQIKPNKQTDKPYGKYLFEKSLMGCVSHTIPGIIYRILMHFILTIIKSIMNVDLTA